MQRLEVSGAVRPIYMSLGVKRLRNKYIKMHGQKIIKFIDYVYDSDTVCNGTVSKPYRQKTVRQLLN